MADVVGQQDLRGIDVDKLARGFADEDIIFKKFVQKSTTSARQIRYYTKTSGFCDTTDTTGVTASQIPSMAWGARPPIVQQSWTREDTYVRPYMAESEWISEADIKDSDPDVLGTLVRDITRAVSRQVDKRIFNVISENLTPVNINNFAAVWGVWTASASGNPVLDIERAKSKIRQKGYKPEGAVLAINASGNEALVNWLITQKGSSLGNYPAEKIKSGAIMSILGINIVVSENAADTCGLMWLPNRTATWKSFTPLTATTISDALIGRKIRVREEGECYMTDGASCVLISGIT